MNDKILYFGYGANKDPSMMQAIVGRIPKGEIATLSGFELCIQKWKELPHSVQTILKNCWDKSFKSYVLRPSNNSKHTVKGVIWELTPTERKLVDNWELTGKWYSVFFLTIGPPRNIKIEIQVVDNPLINKTVGGLNYRTFLNPKQKMLNVARICRQEFLSKNTVN